MVRLTAFLPRVLPKPTHSVNVQLSPPAIKRFLDQTLDPCFYLHDHLKLAFVNVATCESASNLCFFFSISLSFFPFFHGGPTLGDLVTRGWCKGSGGG